MDKKSYCIAWLMLLFVGSLHAQYRTTTYCNPLNLDYTYPFHNSHLGKSYRSGADPAVVEFRGEYYMFVTRSWGYWHSKDLLNWDFITPEKWYFEGCNAPAAHNYKDSVLYVCGNPSGAMSTYCIPIIPNGGTGRQCHRCSTTFRILPFSLMMMNVLICIGGLPTVGLSVVRNLI